MAFTIKINQTTFSLIKGDITKIKADIIVNAANTSLLGGGGVDGAIHRAGGPLLLEECRKIKARQGGCAAGDAVITAAGNLPASYVIHTVGPVWNGGNRQETELLGSCYTKSMALADKHQAKSIAFPNISTGIYRFPKPLAAETALASAIAYLNASTSNPSQLETVYWVCFDEENFTLYRNELDKYTNRMQG
ncbi:O-acetyl-ADP-ribose deacetylase [Paenibacillus kobensis]|uniref:O-acetyl-ADP-ribose deacetylase n=1 Tax=Paenibacillus kobensis TaxID=59841 RepID=UPI000FD7A6B7|nr:O-acetyl-ADP-ribose deacetylase [Paenibacillus kobensis]